MVVSPIRRAALAASLAVMAMSGAALADTAAGPYLAGRQAAISNNFEAAARYHAQALLRDPGNPELMESVTQAQLALGRVDKALPVARLMQQQGLRSQIAQMVLTGGMIAEDNFDGLLNSDPETQGVGPLVDGVDMPADSDTTFFV